MEYKLVIVKDFFQQTENKDLGKIIWSLMNMKREGYQSFHGMDLLPVSTDDFFGIHAIVCNAETMEPLLTFKVIPYSSCLRYKHRFPLFEIAHGLYNDEEQKQLETFIKQKTQNGRDISYSGGWTKKTTGISKEVSKELNKIYTAIHYHIHEHFELKTITGFGAVDLGTYEFFKKEWGLRSIFNRSVKLPFYNNKECHLILGDLVDVPFGKRRLGEIYNSLWDSRLEFVYVEKDLLKRIA